MLELVSGTDLKERLGFPESERFPLLFARPVERFNRSARDPGDLNLRRILSRSASLLAKEYLACKAGGVEMTM